jgi:hypothetical protein
MTKNIMYFLLPRGGILHRLRLSSNIIKFLCECIDRLDKFMLNSCCWFLVQKKLILSLKFNSFVLSRDVLDRQLREVVLKCDDERTLTEAEDVEAVEDFLSEHVAKVRTDYAKVEVVSIDCYVLGQSVGVVQ